MRPAFAEVRTVRGVRLHSVEDVLQRFCTRSASGLRFRAPDGTEFPLSENSAQLGLGSSTEPFHPMPLDDIESALEGIRFPIEGQTFEVFVLPGARSDLPVSFALNGCIYLSPGVRDYRPSEIHNVVTHELGHLVQETWLPDSDRRWPQYRALRGFTDEQAFASASEHSHRPAEIFAEDFRVLFGDPLARAASIENAALESPEKNPEIRQFFLSLVGAGSAGLPVSLASSPNPSPGNSVLTFDLGISSAASGGGPVASSGVQASSRVRLAVYAADGRRVRTLLDGPVPAGPVQVAFDGRDASGFRLPAGIWFARLEIAGRVITHKLVLVH